MEMVAFERRVLVSPAYDKRDSDPRKNFGISEMKITFLLIGEKGAVQWMIGTGWYTASAREHLRGFVDRHDKSGAPTPWDLGYHSKVPRYEHHTSSHKDCEFTGGPCYYDGSGLNAELLMERFLEEGEAYLWPALEAYYRCTFEERPWPFSESGAIDAALNESPQP